jgi:hypothetical protein
MTRGNDSPMTPQLALVWWRKLNITLAVAEKRLTWTIVFANRNQTAAAKAHAHEPSKIAQASAPESH